MAPPRFSVLIAAHNRSNVLRCAIESVLAQTLGDFELRVVCDGCSDDSAALARSYGDPRIVVLEQARLGHQFGIANAQLADCRGDWIAYLNQDDLWLPRHLALAAAALREDAELYLGRVATLRPDGPELMPPPPHAARRDGIDLYAYYPMSSRVLRREALQRVGPYRDPMQLVEGSAEDWLFRAWRLGVRMRLGETPSVLKINSVLQGQSYRERPDALQQQCLALLRERDPEQRLLDWAKARLDDLTAARRAAPSRWRRRTLREWLRSSYWVSHHALMRGLQAVGIPLGIPPQRIERLLRGMGPGHFQRDLNRARGSDQAHRHP